MPCFDYCSPLWDTCSKGLQNKLQKYHNRAARVISGASYETRSTDVLESLGWETLEKRRLRSKAILMYKILNDHSAPNLKKLFNKRNEIQIVKSKIQKMHSEIFFISSRGKISTT